MCFDQQSKFRGTARAWRADAPGESDDGGGCGDCGTLHRHTELEVSIMSDIQ
jgi:hypothetical protein